MKQVYTLSLALLIAATSFCADAALTNRKSKRMSNPFNRAQISATTSTLQSKSKKSAKTRTEGDTSLESLLGDYNLSGYDMQYEEVENIPMKIYMDGNDLKINYSWWTLDATYDESNGLLSIPANQWLEYDDYNEMDVYFLVYFWDENWDNFDLSNDPALAYFDGESLYFDEDILLGIGNDDYGFYYLDAMPEATKIVPKDPVSDEGWEVVVADTEYVDGFQLPFFGVNQYDYVWDVTVQKSTEVAGLYRIRNPYDYRSPLYYNNWDPTGEGVIVFSIADPEMVKVYPGYYSGYTDEYGDVYNFNLEGYFAEEIEEDNMTPEEFMDSLDLSAVSYYKDGVVYFNNCAYSTQQDASDIYFTTELNLSGYLVLPDASGVKSLKDADNAVPAEYFDLNGRRINRPTEKGIYVVRHGNKCQKIVK